MTMGPVSTERMVQAVERVRERLLRVATALEQGGLRYAVAGGHAVAAWVSRVDAAAVRNTRDVEILVARDDLPAIAAALSAAGFVHRHVAGMDLFLDGPEGRPREAVHVVPAGEWVRPEHPLAAPDVGEAEHTGEFRLVTLDALVRMKLNAYRDKDRVHLRDLAEVGLIDFTWLTRVPPELAERLRAVLEQPDG